MFSDFKKRWREEAGYREVMIIALPLILSTGSWSIQHFVDRMFLTWYSPEAIAASSPAGMLNFTIMSLFIGTASYVSAFVAQYYGSGQYEKIGPSIWQGIYLSIVAGAIMLLFIPVSGKIFDLVGHEHSIRSLESEYFAILCFGGFPAVASASFSGFFSGRGETWPVMWVNFTATAVNVILDYLFVFGNLGFPEMGIRGAAIATVFSSLSALLMFMFLSGRPRYRKTYNTFSGWKFRTHLFFRLMKYGLPSGVHMLLDIAGFTVFILLVGRLGTEYLAATNIAININTLSFMPMIGLGIAVTVLTGQYIGANKPDMAEKATYSGIHLAFFYMAVIALMFFFTPAIFIYPFKAGASGTEFHKIGAIATTLLKFVAVYNLFDSMTIIFASSIKGAGDTKFVMIVIAVVSFLVLDIPSYIAFEILGRGIYTGWTIASIYIIILGIIFYFRFKKGEWKKMRVIEKVNVAVPIPRETPEMPGIETDL